MLRKVLAFTFASSALTQQCPGELHGTPPSDKGHAVDANLYDMALKNLDLKAVISDIQKLMVTNQECWPADYGNYGPFFVRLAWHCSGSYRSTDGKGGCGGGRQRFEPERSWADNTNLDKARGLLWPIKEKYGDGLSWGDLFTLAGTTAVKTMGGPVSKYCAGRIDSVDGTESLDLGPSPQQEKDAPCPVAGHCEKPLGSTTIGLIYLNPEGPVEPDANGTWVPNPDPKKTADTIRDSFKRMGFNDTQTVALIGGGHAFGKTHGACPMGAGPSPLEAPGNPWPGKCGTGKGKDVFTSGFEGPWTTNPTQWDNEFFVVLQNQTWEKHIGPGGHWQWKAKNAVAPISGLMRMTSDVALLADESYAGIVRDFAANPLIFDEAFDQAWYNLTTTGGEFSKESKCIAGSDFPSLPSMRDDDVEKESFITV